MVVPVSAIAIKTLEQEAQEHLQRGSVISAMESYYRLHELKPASTTYLRQLIGINLHLGLTDQAIVNLQKLLLLQPDNPGYYDELAKLFAKSGKWDEACKVYSTLVLQQPSLPDIRFNYAYHLRRAGKYEHAIENYQRALQLGIKNPAEVHLNIALILSEDLRKESEAEQELLKAQKLAPDYLPSFMNLANLYEDTGSKPKTIAQLKAILVKHPTNLRALARLVPLIDEPDEQDKLVKKILSASLSNESAMTDTIDAYYALGQVYDERGEYNSAFHYYEKANLLNATEFPAYDEQATELFFDNIMNTVSADWMDRVSQKDNGSQKRNARPVFISGMFRSGSTLVEQILAGHPNITPGGERANLVTALSEPALSYPAGLAEMTTEQLANIATTYLEESKKLFGQTDYLTDKRPDNFVYLGVLKALFPNARFIYTTRHLLDNCLSVYFVRLGARMNYSVNLTHIAHYYQQQLRLLAHWKLLLKDDLHVVDYDVLVKEPEASVRHLLLHLDLPWADSCLDFYKLTNPVKTASVWQVRQPLYSHSSGRWENYKSHIQTLIPKAQASTE